MTLWPLYISSKDKKTLFNHQKEFIEIELGHYTECVKHLCWDV